MLINEGWNKSNNKNIVHVNSCKENNLININEGDFIIYPNPASQIITITAENKVIEFIEIYNSFGKLVFFKKHNNSNLIINVSDMKKGIYLAKIKSCDKYSTIKFILE